MKLFKYLFVSIYRVWFYILMTGSILLLFPALLLSVLKESWYPFFFRIARIWAGIILFGMGFRPVVKREITYNRKSSYIFVSNHTSMTDIMLMLYVTKNPFVFVGKKELSKLPLFGYFYRRTCILVDRNSSKSKLEVFKSAQKKIKQGLSVCLFPEGGVPDDKNIVLDMFKDGAFRLAIEHNIPVAPMTFHDNKTRFSYNFLTGSPGRMRVKIHETIATGIHGIDDRRILKNQARSIILQELQEPTIL